MCQLTKREEEVLEKLMVADVRVAALDLGVKPSTIYVIRGRINGKKEMCKDFLKKIKRYKRVLGARYYTS